MRDKVWRMFASRAVSDSEFISSQGPTHGRNSPPPTITSVRVILLVFVTARLGRAPRSSHCVHRASPASSSSAMAPALQRTAARRTPVSGSLLRLQAAHCLRGARPSASAPRRPVVTRASADAVSPFASKPSPAARPAAPQQPGNEPLQSYTTHKWAWTHNGKTHTINYAVRASPSGRDFHHRHHLRTPQRLAARRRRGSSPLSSRSCRAHS